MRLLLIEDDPSLCDLLRIQLEKEGYAIDTASNGRDGLFLLKQNFYDGCILDRMLPEMDGLTVLKRARAADIAAPILMLTAMSRTEDLVEGLSNGADDYLTKPFAMPELLARIAVMLRHQRKQDSAILRIGDLQLDRNSLTLTGPSGSCTLTVKERDMLELLMQKEGTVISRDIFFGNVWGADADVSESSLDTYIYFVRRRLKTVGSKWKLITKRGMGYVLTK